VTATSGIKRGKVGKFPQSPYSIWTGRCRRLVLWILKSVELDMELCRSEDLGEIGAEKLWYENRGYSCKVERQIEERRGQILLDV
jgi:hypothetical protein